MKKLSKIFAVALVLAMALSVMSIGAGAIAATAGTTATLVTSASSLAVNDQIVIVAKDVNKALSTTQNSNNRGAANVTKSGNTVTLTANVEVLTLKAGTAAGSFALATADGSYLYAAGGTNSNHLKTGSILNAKASFNFTITSAGVATIKCADTATTKNWIRFNPNTSNNNPLFSCYASGQQDVCVYKLTTAVQDTREDLPTNAGEIVDAIFDLQSGEALSKYYKYDGKITLSGVVVGATNWYTNSSTGNVNFKVKDSTGAEKTLQAYKLGKGTNTTDDDVKNLSTGDTITVSGAIIKNYNGTFEFDGCELVSVTKAQVALPALPTDTDDIIDAIYALDKNDVLSAHYEIDSFTLSGVVVKAATWNDQYGDGQVTIKLDGTDKELLAYQFKAGTIGADVAKALAAGDKVTFTADEAKNYNGTFELIKPVLTAVEKNTTPAPAPGGDTDDSDDTGDSTSLALMVAVMALSLFGMVAVVTNKKTV